MRLSSLTYLLAAAALGAAAGDDADSSDPTRENTYFNGEKVPPILELTASTWEKESKASKWLMVKHYRYDFTIPFSSAKA